MCTYFAYESHHGTCCPQAGGIHSYLAEFSDEAKALGLRTVGQPPGLATTATTTTNTGGGRSGNSSNSHGTDGNTVENAADDVTGGSAGAETKCMWQGVNYTFDKRFSSPSAGANGCVRACVRACVGPSVGW